jgi:iron complex transport system substrate-binding protein
MITIRLARLVVLLLLALAAAGCGSASSTEGETTAPTASPQSAFPVTVRAANGPVRIETRPLRIVSLSATATETLFAIGGGSQVIAVDDQSNFPSKAPKTKLSAYQPNAEAIAAYEPDLVVVSGDAGLVKALRKLGFPVLLDPAAENLDDAYAQVRELGAATGHTGKADKVVAKMQAEIIELVGSVPRSDRPLKVFHELSPDLYSATSKTFIGQVYKLFGFRNIADRGDPTHSGYPQLSAEYVISSSPDLVVLADTKCCKQSAQTVAARPGWTNVRAVHEGRVIEVSDDIASRWGPRIVDFVRVVAEAAGGS